MCGGGFPAPREPGCRAVCGTVGEQTGLRVVGEAAVGRPVLLRCLRRSQAGCSLTLCSYTFSLQLCTCLDKIPVARGKSLAIWRGCRTFWQEVAEPHPQPWWLSHKTGDCWVQGCDGCCGVWSTIPHTLGSGQSRARKAQTFEGKASSQSTSFFLSL